MQLSTHLARWAAHNRSSYGNYFGCLVDLFIPVVGKQS